MEKDRQLAIEKLKNSSYSLVVVKNNKIQYKSKEESVGSIVDLMDNRADLLKKAVVADKIIGRAVAMICDYASVSFCYGLILSQGAVDHFNKVGLPYQAEKVVKTIRNRDDTDLCPMEKLTLEVENSLEGVKKIREFLNKK